MDGTRGQAHVVGVALLAAMTVLAVATMTAAVGTVVERRADAAGAARVATGFDDALSPRGAGPRETRVPTPGGGVRTVDREVRLLAGGTTVRTFDANGLVYGSGADRVAFVAGGVARGRPGSAALVARPPLAVRNGVLLAGVTVLGAPPGDATDAPTAVVRTDVSHDRVRRDAGDYRLAVETRTPGAWSRALPAGLRTETRDVDGDGVPSVVVDAPDDVRLSLAVHRLDARVSAGVAP
jgi:hypothetical protein